MYAVAVVVILRKKERGFVFVSSALLVVFRRFDGIWFRILVRISERIVGCEGGGIGLGGWGGICLMMVSLCT